MGFKLKKVDDLREVLALGVIQEANRRFFHVIGYALTVEPTTIKGRLNLALYKTEDEAGIAYDHKFIDREKYSFVHELITVMGKRRLDRFGWLTQPHDRPTKNPREFTDEVDTMVAMKSRHIRKTSEAAIRELRSLNELSSNETQQVV